MRLRRRGRADHASWDRAALFACGLAARDAAARLTARRRRRRRSALGAHAPARADRRRRAGAAAASPCAGPLLAFLIPAAVVRFADRNAAVQATLGRLGNAGRSALAAWAAAIAVWHVPAVYDAALRRPWLHALEHATLRRRRAARLAAPDRPGRPRAPVGEGARCARRLPVPLGPGLCDVLFLSPAPLYPAYAGTGHGLFGLTPLADQQYAGLVMMAEQFADARDVRRAARVVAAPPGTQAAAARLLSAGVAGEREPGRRERRAVGEDARAPRSGCSVAVHPGPRSPIAIGGGRVGVGRARGRRRRS